MSSNIIDETDLKGLEFNKTNNIGLGVSSATPIVDNLLPKGVDKIKLNGDWLNPHNQIDRNIREMVEGGLTDPNYIYDEYFKDKYKVNRDNARKDAIKAQNRIDILPVTSYSALAKGVTKGASDMQLTDPAALIDKTLNEIDGEELSLYLNRVVDKRNPANDNERNQFVNEEYKRLTDTIYNRVSEDYQDQFKPKSDSEFILGSALKDNIVSNIASGMGRGVSGASSFSDMARDISYGKYSENDAGLFDNIIAGVSTIMADAPAFIGATGIGTLAHKGALQNIGRFLVTKNVGTNALKKIPKAYLEKIGEYAMEKTLWARTVADGAMGAATFGSYEASRDIANQYKYKEFDPAEIVKSGLKGATIGGLIGGSNGLLYTGRGANPVLTLKEKLGKGSLDSSIYAMGDIIDSEEHKLTGDIDVDFENGIKGAEKWLNAVGTIGAITLITKSPKLIKQRYKAYAKDVKFTPQELEIIRKEGLTTGDKSLVNRIIALGYTNPIPEKFNGEVVKEFNIATDKQLGDGKGINDDNSFEQFITDNSEVLANEYKDFMYNSNIPASARAKMMFIVEGKTVTPPAVSRSKITKEVDSESGKEQWVVDALALDGSIIERIPFDSKSKAVTRNLENTHIGQINTSKELLKEIGRLKNNEMLTDSYNKAIKENKFQGGYNEFVDRYNFLFKKYKEDELPEEYRKERALFVGMVGANYRNYISNGTTVPYEVRNYYNINSLDDLLAKPIEARTKRENDIAEYYLSELRKEYLKLNDPVRKSLVEDMPDVPMPEVTDPCLYGRPTRFNSLTGRETLHSPESYEVIISPEFKEWYGDWEVANKVIRNRLFYRPKKEKFRFFMPTKMEQSIMINNRYAPIKNMEQGIMINVDMNKVLENNPHKSGMIAVDMKVAIDNMGWFINNAAKVSSVEGADTDIYYAAALIGGNQYSVKMLVDNGDNGSHTLVGMELFDFGKHNMGWFHNNKYMKLKAKSFYNHEYKETENDRIHDFWLDMGAGVLDPKFKIGTIVPRSNVEDYKAAQAVDGLEFNGEPDPIFVKYFLEGRESPLKDPNNTIYYESVFKVDKNMQRYIKDMKKEYIRQIYADKAKMLLEEKRSKAKLLDDGAEEMGENLPAEIK